MNLADIANHACLKIGLTDSATIALAKSFARQRYGMLWDQENWRQSLTTAQLGVAAETAEVTMPTGMERVTAIRWDTRMLDGMDHGTAMQLRPDTFDQLGDPIGFIELPLDSSNNARIRLVPPPRTAGNLYVLGKRACPGLPNDTSVPLLAGASPALCALVLGDLWQWQHQFTKADSCFSEGTRHFETMRTTERQQSATTQRLVPADGIGSNLLEWNETQFW